MYGLRRRICREDSSHIVSYKPPQNVKNVKNVKNKKDMGLSKEQVSSSDKDAEGSTKAPREK